MVSGRGRHKKILMTPGTVRMDCLLLKSMYKVFSAGNFLELSIVTGWIVCEEMYPEGSNRFSKGRGCEVVSRVV